MEMYSAFDASSVIKFHFTYLYIRFLPLRSNSEETDRSPAEQRERQAIMEYFFLSFPFITALSVIKTPVV